jgi:hypothetical protein
MSLILLCRLIFLSFFSLHEALGSCSVACLAVAGDIVPVCPNVAQDI